jgi:hypothetical protein
VQSSIDGICFFARTEWAVSQSAWKWTSAPLITFLIDIIAIVVLLGIHSRLLLLLMLQLKIPF